MAESTRRDAGGQDEERRPARTNEDPQPRPPDESATRDAPVDAAGTDTLGARQVQALARAERDRREVERRHQATVERNATAVSTALPPGRAASPLAHEGIVNPETGEYDTSKLPKGVSAADLPASPPMLGWYTTSTYIVEELNILASTVMAPITETYMIRAADLTADANGDKIVMEGTVMMASVADATKVAPRTGSYTAVGVNWYRVNAREGDVPIALITGHALLRSNFLTDNGTFGTVAAGAITTLSGLGIRLRAY